MLQWQLGCSRTLVNEKKKKTFSCKLDKSSFKLAKTTCGDNPELDDISAKQACWLKLESNVLFFLWKLILSRPSHSLKQKVGTISFGESLTTAESTRGGGLKFFLPTWTTCSTFAKNWTFTEILEYKESPGEASRRSANSFWNISTAVLNWIPESSLNIKGEEIL